MDGSISRYAIRIKGHLGDLARAFPNVVARESAGETLLIGALDRSELFGVLATIEALGLDLLEVRPLDKVRRRSDEGSID